jgi:hypothetical protein
LVRDSVVHRKTKPSTKLYRPEPDWRGSRFGLGSRELTARTELNSITAATIPIHCEVDYRAKGSAAIKVEGPATTSSLVICIGLLLAKPSFEEILLLRGSTLSPMQNSVKLRELGTIIYIALPMETEIWKKCQAEPSTLPHFKRNYL